MLEKYVSEDVFNMSEEELREVFDEWGTVGIHYSLNYPGSKVSDILRLREEVLKDYPNLTDDDMTVWVLSPKESWRHTNYKTLFVEIPIEDYLKLRKEKKLQIR